MSATPVDLINLGLVVVPTAFDKAAGVPADATGLTLEQAEARVAAGMSNNYNAIIGSTPAGHRSAPAYDIETDGPIGEAALLDTCGGTIPAGPWMRTASGSIHRLFAIPAELPAGRRLKFGQIGFLPKVDAPWQFLALEGDQRVWHDLDQPTPPIPAGLLEMLLTAEPVEREPYVGDGVDAWGAAALADEADKLAALGEKDNRGLGLYMAANRMASRRRHVDLAEARDVLLAAARANGSIDKYGEDAMVRQFDNGIRDGMARPEDGPAMPTLGTFSLRDEPSLDAIGVSERFVQRNVGRVRYVLDMGVWLVWDGKRWCPDPKIGGAVQEMAKQTVQALHDSAAEALSAGDSDQYKTLTRLVNQMALRVSMIPQLASSSPELQCRSDELDADPYLLNCQNGTVDLRTGELRDHNPHDLITKISAVDYAPVATGEWQHFLDQVVPDTEIQGYLRRMMGYTLIGAVTEHRMPFLEGPPRSGKSTFVETCNSVVGDYAATANVELFLRGGKAEYELAKLRGARLISMAEFDEHARINVELVKKVTGGDTVPAREIYGSPFSFKPVGTIWVSTNHMPWVGSDAGAWARIRRIPFNVSFMGREDVDLPARLRNDPAVLAWIVQGAQEYQRDGMGEPTSVLLATDEVKQDQNPVARFMDEKCRRAEGAETDARDLYNRYKSWAANNGESVMTAVKFGLSLSRLGVGHRKSNGVVYRPGIALRPEALEDVVQGR